MCSHWFGGPHRRATVEPSYGLAENLDMLARHVWEMGRLDEAEAIFSESVEMRLELCPKTAWTARSLSSALLDCL